MKTLVTIALLLGGATFAQAHTSHDLRVAPRAESFMGSVLDPRLIAPLDRDFGMCNGGPCTATGGPSGGPNQS